MRTYTLVALNKLSKDLNYNRDSLEKVLRLTEVLKLFNEHEELKGKYVLKGGTAINLCLFDFPRLSVDIDLDFNLNLNKEDLEAARKLHQKIISENISINGYQISPRSRFSYTLDSYLLQYTNAVGNIDNIKVEINYSNRVHVLKPKRYNITSKVIEETTILGLDKVELYGSKISALIGRTTARDIFDVAEMISHQIIKKEEHDTLRKTVIFYLLLSNEFEPLEVLLNRFKTNIKEIDFNNIRRNLLPMLKIGTNIDVEELKEEVLNYIDKLLVITNDEQRYIDLYNQGQYEPSFLFEQDNIVSEIKDHPMAVWKMINLKNNK
ncbi:MAG: nucleotidyl transferase AbiEii/AbiGii toxin family protein [Acholeplasmataceae bacterium]|jgi:predicted nucleotidyltransferase component of viral defense system|nr:nucleotidyl transferase AbiEii/AbiGii toxin family protein [Acholeplasmataceae bacterium]